MKKEFKSFPLEIKSSKQDDDHYYFDGYLSTFGNVDRGNDIILKGAFIDSLKKHRPSLFWSHNNSEPLGVFESLIEDDKGLYIKAKMPLSDDFVAKRIIPQMKVGSINSMSIGYSVWDKSEAVEDRGAYYEDSIRYLKRVFLWEGSLVTIPMNPSATLKILDVSDLKKLAPADFETKLCSGVKLTDEASKLLASFFKYNTSQDDSKLTWEAITDNIEKISNLLRRT